MKLVPALPGWRIVSVWADGEERPTFDYEPIAAWAELDDRPGELVPIRREGICEAALLPLDANDLTFLAILAPFEQVDHTSLNWKARIGIVLERQAQEDGRDVKALATVKAAEPIAAPDHVALMHSADVLIEEKLDSGEPASESWLVGAMLLRHPGETPEEIRSVVRDVFAARRSAELSGTPAEHLEHAAELERYLDDREKKNKAGGDRTEGDVR